MADILRFVANIIRFPALKAFWESVKVWQYIYKRQHVGRFLYTVYRYNDCIWLMFIGCCLCRIVWLVTWTIAHSISISGLTHSSCLCSSFELQMHYFATILIIYWSFICELWQLWQRGFLCFYSLLVDRKSYRLRKSYICIAVKFIAAL